MVNMSSSARSSTTSSIVSQLAKRKVNKTACPVTQLTQITPHDPTMTQIKSTQETTSRKQSTATTSATRIGSSSNIKQWSELARTREGNVTVRQVLDFGAQKTTRRRDKKSSRILQPAENKPKLKLEVEKVEKKKPSKSPLMKEKIRKFEPEEHLSKKEDDSKKPKKVNKHNSSTEVEKNNKPADNPLQVFENTKEDISLPTRSQK